MVFDNHSFNYFSRFEYFYGCLHLFRTFYLVIFVFFRILLCFYWQIYSFHFFLPLNSIFHCGINCYVIPDSWYLVEVCLLTLPLRLRYESSLSEQFGSVCLCIRKKMLIFINDYMRRTLPCQTFVFLQRCRLKIILFMASDI